MYLNQILELNQQDDKIAVISGDKKISYKDLKDYVLKMVSLLLNLNIQNNDRVIIYLDKSIEYIISIFAILQAGATYVPIDNSIPNVRLECIIKNCGSKLIIVDSKGLVKIQETIKDNNQKVIVIDDFSTSVISCKCTNQPKVTYWNADKEINFTINNEQFRSEKDIAYIIYTSGSTGAPKGVMIKHESVVAFVKSIINIVEYSSDTRYLNVSPLHFDASIVDVFCTLSVGGTLVLMENFVLPSKLLSTMEKYKITDTLLVSSILKLLVSKFVKISNYNLSNLRTIWYGAESCPAKVVHQIKRELPQLKFIHGYGPTEATHSTTLFIFSEIMESNEEFMPIGKPLPNINVVALNEDNKVIKPNEIGQLYIGGLQLFAGYCNDPRKDKEVIIEDLLGTGERFYKTGDYVSIDNQGNYLFRGRKDDMVKIAGKIVYLNEVESVLLGNDAIEDAYVISINDAFFNSKIISYVVLKDDYQKCEQELSDYLGQKLPKYMIPSKFIIIKSSEVPKSSTGKVDRKKLQTMYSEI